jgi:DNA-binding Lrp family transcriptional regulator
VEDGQDFCFCYEVSALTVAYVLAKVEAGKDQEVLAETKKMPGVRQAIPTYGIYDLHVEVAFDSMDELDRFIFDKIRRLPGIKETVTLIAFKGT